MLLVETDDWSAIAVYDRNRKLDELDIDADLEFPIFAAFQSLGVDGYGGGEQQKRKNVAIQCVRIGDESHGAVYNYRMGA